MHSGQIRQYTCMSYTKLLKTNLGLSDKHIPTFEVIRVRLQFSLTFLPMFTEGPRPIRKSLLYLTTEFNICKSNPALGSEHEYLLFHSRCCRSRRGGRSRHFPRVRLRTRTQRRRGRLLLVDTESDMNCTLLRTADQKLLLLFRKANCNNGNVGNKAEAESSDEVISYPKAELWRHCLLRGANLGSFVSIIFGTPVLLYKGVRQPIALLQRLSRISTYGVVCAVYLHLHVPSVL